MCTQSIELSVVMPAYNEENHIYTNLLTTCKCIEEFCPNYEIVAVNDGSKDNTFTEIMKAREVNPHIKVVNYTINRGKGGAIKEGIAHAKGEYIAFLDSDLDLSPNHLHHFLDAMKKQHSDIVIGSKLHPDSKINYPLRRKILSLGYYILLKVLFRLDLKDTQTGVKLFRNACIKPLAQTLSTTGYAFDIELLARASKMKYSILEMPICLDYQRTKSNASGRIRIKDIFSMFFDTLRIYILINNTKS